MPIDFVQIFLLKKSQIAGPQSPFLTQNMQISAPKCEHCLNNPLE